jgi:hypothetical protein
MHRLGRIGLLRRIVVSAFEKKIWTIHHVFRRGGHGENTLKSLSSEHRSRGTWMNNGDDLSVESEGRAIEARYHQGRSSNQEGSGRSVDHASTEARASAD